VTPERYARVKEVFGRAIDAAPEARAALLDEECRDDPTLREEVESLLALHAEPGDFLARPPLATLAPLAEALATRQPTSATTHALALVCLKCRTRYGPDELVCKVDGTILVEDPESLVGTTLDDLYEIERLLGKGGMGAVYRARHVLLRDRVALKLLPRQLSSSAEWLQRFLREGRAARSVRHPNVVQIHDLRVSGEGPADRIAYLVMEYIEGHTLREEARKRRFTPAETLALVEPVAAALDAAHARGIVHRDLKPENVMLAEGDGERAVKVLDLGIAKLRESGDAAGTARLTQPGQRLGTPAYMSPEQWESASSDDIDGRADVYALGVMCFELVAGRRPFRDKSAVDLRAAHLSAERPRLDVAAPGIPEGFARAVGRALALDREERQATAGRLVRELRDSLAGAPDEADPARTAEERAWTTAEVAAETRPMPTTNLPRPITSFVGRRYAVDEVREALSETRVVTLVGMGGIGKTRLAVEAAWNVAEGFENGVWFVELGALTQPEHVAQAVATALGAREAPGRSLTSVLVERLRADNALLVLDNCEHLAAACGELAAELARACPDLRILTTSREALGVGGEFLLSVAPLALPTFETAGDPLDCDAVRLFVERAKAVNPRFAPGSAGADTKAIGRLCERLDGIPLAIELAAARVKVLSVGQILERMEDRFRLLTGGDQTALPHQQTLRATLDWSYGLLADEERAMLRRLSIFAGGWTLEAAEGVLGPLSSVLRPSSPEETVGDEGPRTEDVLDLLSHLVDKSLVHVSDWGEEPRYGMLETIRGYAEEKLREAGEEDAIRAAHGAWFHHLARRAYSDLHLTDNARWMASVEADYDNWRAALRASVADPDAVAYLCCALGRFWRVRGHWAEGDEWLGHVLGAGGARDPELRAKSLHAAGELARAMGDFARARPLLEASVSLHRGLGDLQGVALAIRPLGHLLLDEGEMSEAEAAAAESLAITEEIGDRIGFAQTTNLLGRIETQRGEYDRAASWYEKGLVVDRAVGRHSDAAIAVHNLGMIAQFRGDFDRAEELFDESLAIARSVGFTQSSALSSQALGEVARHRGDLERAEMYFRQALGDARKLGDMRFTAACLASLGNLANDKGNFEDARAFYADALATDSERRHKAVISEVLDGFACVAARDDPARAVRLAAAAEALREEIGDHLAPSDQAAVDRYLDRAREALAPEQVERAIADGRAMELEQAIAYALSAEC
jgi:predicted ATPase/serine/threonine protein kinase